MSEWVERLGIRREAGYLYYLRGVEVWRAPMRGKSGVAERLAVGKFAREPGYLYYLDEKGDIRRASARSCRPDPLADLKLLALDELVWWKDPEADVGMGNDVYCRTLKEWAGISRGSFTPENISEQWATERGPIQVAFRHRASPVVLRPRYKDDWIDLSIIGPINQLLSEGPRFCVLKSDDQLALVVALTSAEQRRLEQERNWSFVEI